MHQKMKDMPELGVTHKWALGFTQEMAQSLLENVAVKLMILPCRRWVSLKHPQIR